MSYILSRFILVWSVFNLSFSLMFQSDGKLSRMDMHMGMFTIFVSSDEVWARQTNFWTHFKHFFETPTYPTHKTLIATLYASQKL